MTSPVTFPLGRRVNHDPRSRRFAFTDRPEARAAVVSVHWPRRSPIHRQTVGSCTGHAAAGWLGTDGAGRTGRVDISDALAVAIYSAATQIDPFPGQYPPDDTGSDGLSVAKVLQAWGSIATYTHCFTAVDVLAALQYGPVLCGVSWYESMFTPGPRGLLTVAGDAVGGHEFLVDGVDVDAREVIGANQWGPEWGDRGWFRLSYDDYVRLLAEDGDATVLHPGAVAPEPVPASFRVALPPAAADLVIARAARAKVTPEEWITARVRAYLGV